MMNCPKCGSEMLEWYTDEFGLEKVDHYSCSNCGHEEKVKS